MSNIFSIGDKVWIIKKTSSNWGRQATVVKADPCWYLVKFIHGIDTIDTKWPRYGRYKGENLKLVKDNGAAKLPPVPLLTPAPIPAPAPEYPVALGGNKIGKLPRIHDERKPQTVRADEVRPGSFILYQGALCQRLNKLTGGFDDRSGVPISQTNNGVVNVVGSSTEVTPVEVEIKIINNV